ncbi:MAG: ferritin-like domain-containing protein [Solirubrobacteraceae bacterium]|nr:ferritin-like domain-containing protein [Solirubrobacteraceae bacterium]
MSQAIPTIEVQSLSRHALLLRGAVAVGAVYGAASVSPFVRRAFAQSEMGDVDILNFALTLEYLETAFYELGDSVGLRGENKKLATEFGSQEAEHVEALTGTIKELGGKPVKKPSFDFGVSDEKGFLKLAQTLEDTGVGAYNGAAPMIKSKEVLAAAGSIVQVEARHAAAIRLLRGNDPAPDAFEPPLTEDQVLKAVKPLIVA